MRDRARVAVTDDIAACRAIRRAVFIDEQGVDPAIEVDDKDEDATHVLAECDGHAIGTARIEWHGVRAKIGRVAVLPGFRGQGVARALMQAALARIDARPEIEETILAAQAQAAAMYEPFGFTPFAEETIAAMPHIWMRRLMNAQRSA